MPLRARVARFYELHKTIAGSLLNWTRNKCRLQKRSRVVLTYKGSDLEARHQRHCLERRLRKGSIRARHIRGEQDFRHLFQSYTRR